MTKFIISCGLLLFFCGVIDSAPVADKSGLQVIPPLPLAGYVPVFVRKGDQPLEEIDPQLAEAFRALEAKSAHEKIAPAAHRRLLTPFYKDLPAPAPAPPHHKQVGNNDISNSRQIIIPVIIQTGFDTPDHNMAEMIKKKILEGGLGHIQKIAKHKH